MERGRRKVLNVVVPLTAALTVVACVSEGGGAEGRGDAEEQSPTVEGQPESAGAVVDTSTFSPLGASGVTGDVQLTRREETLEVTVYADMGVLGDFDYPSHIHSGTCQELGSAVGTLQHATAGDVGIAEATSEVDISELQAGQSYVVVVHGRSGEPAGCSPIPSSLL